MNDRAVRQSTKVLRSCVTNTRQTPRSAPGHSRVIHARRFGNVNADSLPIEDDMEPNNDLPAGQDGGQPGRGDKVDQAGHADGQQLPKTLPQGGARAAPKDDGYDTRLKNIEEILVEMRKEKEQRDYSAQEHNTRSRSKSRSAARSTRSANSPANKAKQPRHRCGGHRSPCCRHRSTSRGSARSRHRSSKSRSGTPTSRASRSGSRSHRRKRSRSRSRSLRSRSGHQRRRKTRSGSKESSRARSPSSRSSARTTRDGRDVARALGLQYPENG